MKKTFPLTMPGKQNARVLDAIKHDVRKYVKRERGKRLPEGFAQWAFQCRVGPTEAEAQATPLPDISSALDAVAQTGVPSVYVEVLAFPAQREAPK